MVCGGEQNGSVYISQDGGASWTQQTSVPTNGNWTAVAASGDGGTLAAVDSGDYIYTYQNLVWTAATGAGTNAWSTVATSYNGGTTIVGTAGMRVSSARPPACVD